MGLTFTQSDTKGINYALINRRLQRPRRVSVYEIVGESQERMQFEMDVFVAKNLEEEEEE